MNSPMPKDNEVDEKVIPDSAAQDAVSWEGRGSIGGTIGNWHKITRDEYDYHIKNPRLTYEVRALVPAATVAELRAEVERRKDALAAMSQFAKVAEERADAAERRVGELEEFISAGIEGVVVEMGDDEDGNPRVTLHTSREQIKREVRNLIFKQARLIPLLTGADPT